MEDEEFIKLEHRVEELEQKMEVMKQHNLELINEFKSLLSYVSKWKHPASRFVVVCSIVISTIINQLPVLLPLFLNK